MPQAAHSRKRACEALRAAMGACNRNNAHDMDAAFEKFEKAMADWEAAIRADADKQFRALRADLAERTNPHRLAGYE